MTEYTATNIILKDASGNYVIPYTEKQDPLTEAQLNAVNSGITSTKVGTYDGYATAIAAKQDSLTTAQLNAVNSGITSTKVGTYDGYATTIAGKMDKVTLATVATSGSYNDLSNKPTIPTITDTYSATSSNGMSGKAVASAISGKADSSTTLSGYGITDAYTKTEVDSKVSSVYKYKGSVESVSALPTTGQTVGDVYNVQDTGMNYAWTGTEWDSLGASIDLSPYAKTADLATVATSGSYTDLSNKPTIPSAVTETTVSGWGFTKNTGTVTSVNNTSPVNGNVTLTIPTVNNATLTIQKNGTNVQTFTANSSTDATANITVPVKVSELTNDSGFTSNVGTITGITMNGSSKGTSGVVNLGTVITDVSGKQDKLTAGTNITIDETTNTISSTGGGNTVSYDSTTETLIFS